MEKALASQVGLRLSQAAARIGTVDPVRSMSTLLKRTFPFPQGDPRYANNALTPGAAPLEPSYSELQSDKLRIDLQPLEPDASAVDRRDDATREMRRMVSDSFGGGALRWFDERSEMWRGFGSGCNLKFGAFFGTTFDRDGLYNSKVYYETTPGQLEALPAGLFRVVSTAMHLLPGLRPLFTTISAQRNSGAQQLTFAHPAPLRIAELQPLLDAFGIGHRIPALLQIVGVTLGGRFDLPAYSTLIGLGQGPDGPEFELHILLAGIPDLPPNFLGLLALGLSERPRELSALERWMSAFTPDDDVWPGRFSILSVRTSATAPPRVMLSLRPAEFEVPEAALRGTRPQPDYAVA